MYEKMSSDVFKTSGLYLVLLTNGNIHEIKSIFDILWSNQIYNVNVLFEDENKSILVHTFMPFTAGQCSGPDPVLINEFLNGKFTNDLKKLFANKMQNLHNCPVTVSIAVSVEPYVIIKRFSNGRFKLTGEDIKVLKALSQSLNFKIVYIFIGNGGCFLSNGTALGTLKALLDGLAEISISNWWLKVDRLQFLDATNDYLSDAVSFIIPSGQELSSFEKLAYPFEFSVWAMVLICFLIGFIVIFTVNCRQKVVQHFVLGPVANPYYNMLVALLGGAQNVLPKTNFARFLLMMFLMYSLVMRTLYQGAFYELLRSNKHHKKLESMAEIIQKD